MKTEDALKHFGSNTELTAALKLSSGAVSQWGKYPPVFRQLQIEKLTNGRLKAEKEILRPKKANRMSSSAHKVSA